MYRCPCLVCEDGDELRVIRYKYKYTYTYKCKYKYQYKYKYKYIDACVSCARTEVNCELSSGLRLATIEGGSCARDRLPSSRPKEMRST